MGERVAHEVHAAALPGRAEHLGDRRLDALVRVGDDELHAPAGRAGRACAGSAVQKVSASEGPMSMPSTSRRPSLLTPTATITATETTRPLLLHLHVGRVDPQVGPVALDRAVEEGLHALVDLLAEPAHLALRDAAHAERLDQVVDGAGRDPLDVGLLDHGGERLLGQPARLQEAREVGALAQLRDAQLDRAGPGLPVPLAIAVALGQPLGALLAVGRRRSGRRPPAPSGARPQSRSSRAAGRRRGSSPRARAGSSSRRSSVVLGSGWSRNPTLPGIADDHREAARPLQRYGKRAVGRLRYRRATPPLGTRPHSSTSGRSALISGPFPLLQCATCHS